MILRTLIAFALAILIVAMLAYYRRRSPSRRLILFAALCFWVVAFAHVCEAFGLFPSAGWGQTQSLDTTPILPRGSSGSCCSPPRPSALLWHRAHP